MGRGSLPAFRRPTPVLRERRDLTYRARAFPDLGTRPPAEEEGALRSTEEDRVVEVRAAEATGGVDRFFRISERGSSIRTEIVAGVTTWLTMAYILFVNPAILGFAAVPDLQPLGLPFGAVLTVTALVAGVMTVAMGLWANYPFAIAAGLGLNAFVAFTLVAGLGLSFPEAMGVIVVEGLVITALVLTGFREAVVHAIPTDLKRAIAIGIGLFLTMIGLVNAGVVIPGAGTVVTLTDNLTSLRMLTFAIGLTLCSILVVRKVRGGLLIGIVATTVIASIINAIWGDNAIWSAVGPGVAQIPTRSWRPRTSRSSVTSRSGSSRPSGSPPRSRRS